MITVYCDMDGVLSNFDDAYVKWLNGRKPTRESFREATEDYRIFRNLEEMPNIITVLQNLSGLENEGINIEILSSINTVCASQKIAVIEDKTAWLRARGIDWATNLVNCKEEKRIYATPNAYLIDDNIMNCREFNDNYGIGILHIDASAEVSFTLLKAELLDRSILNK